MPKAREIGLKKHLEKWDTEREKEKRHKEKLAEVKRKTAENRAKAKFNTSKKTLSRSKRGRRKTVGAGVSLKSLFGRRR